MSELALAPADVEPRAFERRNAPFERLRAARPEGHMAHAGSFRCRELERITLVVVPSAKVDGVALKAALGHAKHVDKKTQALIGLGREKFQVAQVGDIHHRFGMHVYVLSEDYSGAGAAGFGAPPAAAGSIFGLASPRWQV